jgi:hypothetical protein
MSTNSVRELKLDYPGAKVQKVGNNTYRVTDSPKGSERIVLHRTEILRRDMHGWTRLDSGGWRTPTTKKRINAWASGFQLVQKKHEWFLVTDRGLFNYFDKSMVSPTGYVYTERSPYPQEAIPPTSKRGAK